MSTMTTKIEQSSSVPMSTNSSKISMLTKKSGFLIPKNKLSGSLVPAYRSGGKAETGSVATEEANKARRKTKWGVDLMQDPVVRKGRALAYQNRVNQITKHLKAEASEAESEQGARDSVQINGDVLFHQRECDEADKSEQLKLEMREAIGEILLLSPNYKAPADYKPILKEARILVPSTLQQKYHYGYSFMNAFLGRENNTQKRLEEETGAKIRVYGTAKDTGEKREVDQLLKRENGGDLEDIYVHISADTFEKVDAAVALIELLVTPVSRTAADSTDSTVVVGNSVNASDRIDNAVSSMMSLPIVDQGIRQQKMDPSQSINEPPHLQTYLNPWVNPGPSQPPTLPSGFIPSVSGHVSNVPPVHIPSSYGHPTNIPPNLVATKPPTAVGTAAPHNLPLLPMRPQQSNQALQETITTVSLPQNSSIPSSQISQQHGQQPLFAVGPTIPRPASHPLNSSLMSNSSPQLSNGPSGWSGPVTMNILRPLSNIPTNQPLIPLQRPLHPLQHIGSLNLVHSHPPNVGAALVPHLAPSNSTGSQLNMGSVPRFTTPPDSLTMASATSASIQAAPPPMHFPPPPRLEVSSHGQNPPRMQFPSQNPQPMVVRSPGFILPPSHQVGISSRPSLADFTFQPQPQLSAPQSQNMVVRSSMPPVNSSPLSSFRPALDTMANVFSHQPEQGFTSGPLHNQMGRPNFSPFPKAPMPHMQSASQMGQPGFFPAAYRANLPNPSVQVGNVRPVAERNFLIPKSQPGNNMAYDPFSPT